MSLRVWGTNLLAGITLALLIGVCAVFVAVGFVELTDARAPSARECIAAWNARGNEGARATVIGVSTLASVEGWQMRWEGAAHSGDTGCSIVFAEDRSSPWVRHWQTLKGLEGNPAWTMSPDSGPHWGVSVNASGHLDVEFPTMNAAVATDGTITLVG